MSKITIVDGIVFQDGRRVAEVKELAFNFHEITFDDEAPGEELVQAVVSEFKRLWRRSPFN